MRLTLSSRRAGKRQAILEEVARASAERERAASDWTAHSWPPLPDSWTYDEAPLEPARVERVEPLAVCSDEGCGCTDLEPLVERIAASMARLEGPPARWTVKRERMVLFTGTGIEWCVRDPEGVLHYAGDDHEYALLIAHRMARLS